MQILCLHDRRKRLDRFKWNCSCVAALRTLHNTYAPLYCLITKLDIYFDEFESTYTISSIDVSECTRHVHRFTFNVSCYRLISKVHSLASVPRNAYFIFIFHIYSFSSDTRYSLESIFLNLFLKLSSAKILI